MSKSTSVPNKVVSDRTIGEMKYPEITFSGGLPILLPISFQSFSTSSTLDTNLDTSQG